jgi:ABC-type transporter lipoprotein component MlaA
MEDLSNVENINNAIKVFILENINEDMYEFIRDLYFKLKKEYDYETAGDSSTEEEDDLIMEDISVVKSKEGFYQLT